MIKPHGSEQLDARYVADDAARAALAAEAAAAEAAAATVAQAAWRGSAGRRDAAVRRAEVLQRQQAAVFQDGSTGAIVQFLDGALVALQWLPADPTGFRELRRRSRIGSRCPLWKDTSESLRSHLPDLRA